jgi:hypothetical protein
VTGDMTGDVTGGLTGDMTGAAPQPLSAVAPARAGPGPDRPPDATPVTFMQSVDGAWLRWSVVEVDARAVPGAHGARCLVFTRAECIRRVWDYPADWRTLDDAALAALSWNQ